MKEKKIRDKRYKKSQLNKKEKDRQETRGRIKMYKEGVGWEKECEKKYRHRKRASNKRQKQQQEQQQVQRVRSK